MVRTRLATRMTIHVAVVLVLTLGASGFLIIRGQRRTLMEEARRNAIWAADTFAGAVLDQETPHRWPEMERRARRMATRPRVERVRLIGPTGHVRVSSDGRVEDEFVPLTDAACSGCHRGDGVPGTAIPPEARTIVAEDRSILRAFAAVALEPGCASPSCHEGAGPIRGIVEVDAPLRPINTLISDSVDQTLLISAVATVVAALLGGLALGRWLQRPVKALVAGTRRVAEGDLEHEIPCDRSDELGVLCDAFNRMTARLKETKLLLLRSEKLSSLGKLAAGVAHEINNPLTGILSFAEDMQEELPEDSPLREDCDVIVREALRCRNIVRRLLDFSRPETPSFDRVALNRVARQALALVSRQAKFQNLRVEVLLEPELPPVRGDAGQLQQVVLNLLVNARDALGKRGRITVESHSHSDADRVELTVDDSGPGVPPELRDKIFEPFFSTKADRGSGIGLGVSRSIAEAHGGHLLVTDAPEGGARFRLILPTLDREESRGPPGSEKGVP